MSKLSERQRLIATIVVTVVITGGLLGLIFKDRTEIDETNGEIGVLDRKIALAEVEIAKIRPREDQVLVYRAVEEKELEILPTKQEIANFHRDLSRYLAQAGLSFQELPESTPVESGLAKGILVTRTALSCEGDCASLLRFLNMIENDSRLVAVKGLSVKSGRKRRGEEETAPQHDVQVHLETYFYNPDNKALNSNRIPGAEARLDDDSIRDAIEAFQPERPGTYTLRPAANRRDALVDPREARPTVDPEAEQELFEREEQLVVEIERRVDGIDEKVEQEHALLEQHDLFRHDQLRREVDENLGSAQALLNSVLGMNKVTLTVLLARLDVVSERMEHIGQGRPDPTTHVTAEVAEKAFVDVQKAFDSGDYESVASECSRWARFKDGKVMDAGATRIAEAITTLRQRAATLDEFETLMFRVSGTIVHPVDPARSVALVNGVSHHTGDRLTDGGQVTVGEITRGAVLFHYKGETIRVARESERRTGDTVRATVSPR